MSSSSSHSHLQGSVPQTSIQKSGKDIGPEDLSNLDPNGIDALVKKFRKKPLFQISELPVSFGYGPQEIESIIPHRSPLRLVDRLIGFDLARGRIAGERYMDPNDPVFIGHFPGAPLYPGTLSVEAIGQLGLCMYYFLTKNTTELGDDAQPVTVRATKIAASYFLQPIPAGSTVQILAQTMSFDGYFASILGQVLVEGKVAVVTTGEVMILD